MLELLAPAGDIKSFDTAINCGADAVYLGLSDFNARRKAENFTSENLRECVRRAHFYGVKVYVTVNTLVYDNEMPELISLVKTAVEAKADAFIVQDLGVARCLLKAFPDIVLHASTQLGVHNLYGAKIAEEIGFKRVVLSRETKLDDIKAIREGTELEIEYFVQGALCVAFSGNCYLSAVEQNASGNRGLCKQLCRLPYRATVAGDSADGYLLSAKDLCLANSLHELADAGVTSFKIEGRLRREGYVGSAVSIYRRIIDGIKTGEKLKDAEMTELKIAYSRGGGYLERAYLDGGTPSVIEKQFNNHTGLEVGEVLSVEAFKKDLYKVTVSSNYPLSKGDGLKFFEKFIFRNAGGFGAKCGKHSTQNSVNIKWKEVASLGVGDISECGKGKFSFVTKTPVKVGWSLHLISNADRIYNAQKVAVTLDVKAKIGEHLALTATTEGGVKVSVLGDVCECAKTSPISANDIANQASKTADSGFYVTDCSVDTNGVFIAKSALNALRRDLFFKLTEAVIANNEKHIVSVDENAISAINGSLNYQFENINIVFVHSDELRNSFDKRKFKDCNDIIFVLCPDNYSVSEIEKMTKALDVQYDNIALQLPVIANGKDLAVIEKLLAELPQIRTLVSENIYGFTFADKGYKVIAGAGHNTLNGYAKAECEKLGATCVLPSIESAKRSDNLGEELPLMTFAHCPYKTVYGNECDRCSYCEGMTLTREHKVYRVRRTKIASCYFGLY